jgi:hypothetical protein
MSYFTDNTRFFLHRSEFVARLVQCRELYNSTLVTKVFESPKVALELADPSRFEEQHCSDFPKVVSAQIAKSDLRSIPLVLTSAEGSASILFSQSISESQVSTETSLTHLSLSISPSSSNQSSTDFFNRVSQPTGSSGKRSVSSLVSPTGESGEDSATFQESSGRWSSSSVFEDISDVRTSDSGSSRFSSVSDVTPSSAGSHQGSSVFNVSSTGLGSSETSREGARSRRSSHLSSPPG